jgi:hypothetical protein
MTKPEIKIVDSQTGEEIIREMTDGEFAQWQLDQEVAKEKQDLEEARAAQRAELLARLGITADEAKLLLA